MRIALWLAAVLCLGTCLFAQTAALHPVSTEAENAPKPPSKAAVKRARKLYDRAQRAQKDSKFPQAFDELDEAIKLDPTKAEYLSLQEMIRQQLVTNHISQGNDLLAAKKQVEAMAEFRQALALDPKNEFALQRLEDSLPARAAINGVAPLSHTLRVVAESQPTVLQPSSAHHDFHYKGMSRGLLELIANTYGVKAMFDESVTNKPVRFDIEDVDFYTAAAEAGKMAKAFWFALTPKQAIFVNDTAALHREMDRLVTRTFYIGEATTATDVNDVVNLMRTIFDIRFVAAQPNNNSVIVRAPEAALDAATKVLDSFFDRKPQVNLEIQVFEVNHTFAHDIGLNLPTNFQAINVGVAALALLGQSNSQDLINQLFASGGINQGNAQGIQALLAQLQNQQTSSILQQLQTPFTTFGGGKTLFAVPLPAAKASLQMNQSDMQSLEKLTLRVAQGNTATMRIGSRYPILNASFAPLYNSSALTQVLQNGSYTAPFPSFTYEDLGITVKATPQVLSDSSVNLKLEMEIKTLTGQSFNGVPVIGNREYSATMSVKDAEQAAVAGMITQSEQKALTGIPGIGSVPVVRQLTSERTKNEEADELLIVVTPFIVSPARQTNAGAEVWLPTM
jgi:Flp pilus assembly secretin CpaC